MNAVCIHCPVLSSALQIMIYIRSCVGGKIAERYRNCSYAQRHVSCCDELAMVQALFCSSQVCSPSHPRYPDEAYESTHSMMSLTLL